MREMPNAAQLAPIGSRLFMNAMLSGVCGAPQATLLVFVEISLAYKSGDIFEEFRRAALKLPNVLECHLVSGDFDYLLKTRVSDMSAYRRLLGETLLRLPGVNDTRTYVVMEEVKQSSRLVISTR